MKSEISKFY